MFAFKGINFHFDPDPIGEITAKKTTHNCHLAVASSSIAAIIQQVEQQAKTR
jgi:hypothetical protein